MPKSRGRRGRRNRPSQNPRSTRAQASRRGAPAHPTDITPYVQAVMAANEREAAGDAGGAIDVMAHNPLAPTGEAMWAPWRMERLGQLTMLRTWLPKWAHARWIVRQAACQMTHDSVERTVRAVDLVVETRGESPENLSMERRTRIGDRDWMAGQLAVHDLGGLAEFLATGPAVANLAGDIKAWVGTPMRGYRLVKETDHQLVWEELASGAEVATINLGTATCVSSDRCVIGRIVESDGVHLFDVPPCPAPEALAREVSSSPRHWIEAIGRSDEPRMVGLLASGLDAPLLTDVPNTWWQYDLLDRAGWDGFDDDGEHAEPTVAELEDMTVGTILSLLRGPVEDLIDPAVIGAALLQFGVVQGVAVGLGPEHARGLAHLAARIVGPVSNLCADLASLTRQSA